MSSEPLPNVIVFGASGAGKSSVVNMLQGDSQAVVSNGAKGVTFSNTPYEKIIEGEKFKVFDTVGLNEGAAGTVSAKVAIEGLYRLICQLEHGVNLLVYVMRAPRITSTAKQNYEMFFELFCRKQVPIVIVITGLEDERDMDQWWVHNKDAFDQYRMSFDGVACITATKGKSREGVHLYHSEYEESRLKVERLLSSACKREAWKMPSLSWFVHTAVGVRNTFATALGITPIILAKELIQALQLYGGLSARAARKMAWEIERKSPRRMVGAWRSTRLR